MRKKISAIVILVLSVTFSLKAGNTIIQEMKKMQDVFNKINKYHVDDPDYKDVITGAIKGMLGSLDDPYSVYFPPKTKDMFEDRLKQHFGGLGIMINLYTNDKGDTYIQIVDLLEVKENPARDAGILPKDIIIKIDGESAKGINFEQAKEKLRGPVDSTIDLQVKRDTETVDITVVRKEIKIPQVYYKMLGDSIGYLRLISFTELSAEEVKEKVEILEDSGINSLIFDLRNNHGGYLTAAFKIVDLFIDNNQLIVYTKDKHNNITEKYYSEDNIWKKFPIVVLVNGYSASAAEIVTGALKDLGRATIVGEKTFGKGSVQQVYELNDHSGLKLTIAKYYTPSGNIIHKKGIKPNFEVKLTRENKTDVQLEFAENILKSYDLLKQ